MSTLGWFIIVGIVSGLFGFALASILAASARQTAVDEAVAAARKLEQDRAQAAWRISAIPSPSTAGTITLSAVPRIGRSIRRRKKYGKVDVERAKAEYLRGTSGYKIAQAQGVSTAGLYSALRRVGVKIRPRGGDFSARGRKAAQTRRANA